MTMSVSFLLRALNSSWYFSMMQEFELIGLTFMSIFILPMFFLISVSSASMPSFNFWKLSSYFDSIWVVKTVSFIFCGEMLPAGAFFRRAERASRSLNLGISVISSFMALMSSFTLKSCSTMSLLPPTLGICWRISARTMFAISSLIEKELSCLS